MIEADASPTRGRVSRRLMVALFTASALYGATYQQFRYFDIGNPGGAADARSYVEMSHGNFEVSPVRRYRPVIPMLASMIRKPLEVLTSSPAELDKLQFYVVNFTIALVTALLLFATLEKLGFDWRLSALGVMAFVSSRVTVISVGTPLVDSLYFLAVGTIVYLMLVGKVGLLALSMPLLVLSKETMAAFLILPLFNRSTRDWRVVGSVLVSVAAFLLLRGFVDREAGTSGAVPFGAIVAQHLNGNVLPSLMRLGHLAGIHDLLNGFGLLALMVPLGMWVNWRHRPRRLPPFLLVPVPVAFGLALVSGNLGRTFFAAYVPMIASALVLIDHCCGETPPAGTKAVPFDAGLE